MKTKRRLSNSLPLLKLSTIPSRGHLCRNPTAEPNKGTARLRTHATPHPPPHHTATDPHLGGAGRRQQQQQHLAGREPPPSGTKQPPPRPVPLLPAARSQVSRDGQCACAAAAGRRGADRSAEPSRWGPPAGGRWRSRGRRGAPRERQVSAARPCQVPGTAALSSRPLPASTRGAPRAPARIAPLPAGADRRGRHLGPGEGVPPAAQVPAVW